MRTLPFWRASPSQAWSSSTQQGRVGGAWKPDWDHTSATLELPKVHQCPAHWRDPVQHVETLRTQIPHNLRIGHRGLIKQGNAGNTGAQITDAGFVIGL